MERRVYAAGATLCRLKAAFLLCLLLAGCSSTRSIDQEYKNWPLKPERIEPAK